MDITISTRLLILFGPHPRFSCDVNISDALSFAYACIDDMNLSFSPATLTLQVPKKPAKTGLEEHSASSSNYTRRILNDYFEGQGG